MKMIDRPSGLSSSESDKFVTLTSSKLQSAKAKILALDTHHLSRMALVDLLLLDDYEVLEVEDKTSFFEEILSKQPDLILIDTTTSQLDGFGLCKQLKQSESTHRIPVILITLADDRQSRLSCMEVGGDDLMTKPIDRIELSAKVKSALDRKRLNDGLNQTEQVLFTIAKAIESRCSDSASSCARIAALAQEFGEYLQLSAEEIDNLVFAAHLHDIGTIGIPDAVLLKKGELTSEEKHLIAQHVLIGEKILKPLKNRSGVLPIIRHHHERWDGTGYPDRLAGDAIPRLAQIFQILDIFDALSSQRHHKQAFSPAQALEIIDQETAKGWRNPKIVEQFRAFVQFREQTRASIETKKSIVVKQ
jgi:putative two-component system response regulator